MVPTDDAVITFQIPRVSAAGYPPKPEYDAAVGTPDVIARLLGSQGDVSPDPAPPPVRIGGKPLVKPRSEAAQSIFRIAVSSEAGAADFRRYAHDLEADRFEGSTGPTRVQRGRDYGQSLPTMRRRDRAHPQRLRTRGLD